jgi:hypothetical protein
MKLNKKQKIERLQDELEPEKAEVRNLQRIVKRLDGLADELAVVKEIKEFLNSNKIAIPKSFKIENLKDISKEARISNWPETQKTEIKNWPEKQLVKMEKPDWYKEAAEVQKVKVINEKSDDKPPTWLNGILEVCFGTLSKLLVSITASLGKILSKEIYTIRLDAQERAKPNLVILIDPKTGKPVSPNTGGSGHTIVYGGGSATKEKQDDIIAELKAPQGAVVAGTVALASANTWYAVPSSVPTGDYTLIVSFENSNGAIRFSYANVSTPSATYGNLAPQHLAIQMKANTSLYYASTVAGDDINWTTIKQI